MRWSKGLMVLALLALPLAPLGADEPPLPVPRARPPVFSAGTDLVNVTVTVLDKSGHLVSNLGPEDFTVEEDGKPQQVEVFGRAFEPGQEEDLALDLGILFDTSGSMLNELRLSQQAAVRFLDTIPRARELVTIFFDQDIRISRYDSENQQGLFERILEAEGAGETALYDAIAAYISRVGEGRGRKVLVIFTDGDDNTSSLTQPEVLQLVRNSAVTVYPIAFLGSLGRGTSRARAAEAFLERTAAVSGGQLFSPISARDLPAIYDRILSELGAQYVLGFASQDHRRDGRFRRLKVTVRGHDLKVRHRSGYVAPGPS